MCIINRYADQSTFADLQLHNVELENMGCEHHIAASQAFGEC